MNIDGSLTTECVKSINQIGYTTYQNICDGTMYNVQWGVGDWLGGGIIAFILALVILLIIGVVVFSGIYRFYC